MKAVDDSFCTIRSQKMGGLFFCTADNVVALQDGLHGLHFNWNDPLCGAYSAIFVSSSLLIRLHRNLYGVNFTLRPLVCCG